MKILLGRGDFNPDKPDMDGLTPLSCVAAYGYEGVVRIQLERNDDNSESPTNWICVVNRCSSTLLGMGTWKWWRYYSDGTTSTPTSRMTTAEHRYGGLLLLGIKE